MTHIITIKFKKRYDTAPYWDMTLRIGALVLQLRLDEHAIIWLQEAIFNNGEVLLRCKMGNAPLRIPQDRRKKFFEFDLDKLNVRKA